MRGVRDERGQGMTEYAIIIAVVAVAILAALSFVGGSIGNYFSSIGNNLT